MKRCSVILAAGLLLLGCVLSPSPTNTPTPTDTPTPTNTPVPSPTPTPFVGGECAPGTRRIEMGVRYHEHVNRGGYPDCCEVYCLWVPEGDRLEIGISDFDVDLDIYVDTDLTVLQFSDHGQWESNAYGTGDEQVTIYNPGGRYYIQVCSYEGLASDFVLYSEFSP